EQPIIHCPAVSRAAPRDQPRLEHRKLDRVLRIHNARVVAGPQKLLEDQLAVPHPQPRTLAQRPEIERLKEPVGPRLWATRVVPGILPALITHTGRATLRRRRPSPRGCPVSSPRCSCSTRAMLPAPARLRSLATRRA